MLWFELRQTLHESYVRWNTEGRGLTKYEMCALAKDIKFGGENLPIWTVDQDWEIDVSYHPFSRDKWFTDWLRHFQHNEAISFSRKLHYIFGIDVFIQRFSWDHSIQTEHTKLAGSLNGSDGHYRPVGIARISYIYIYIYIYIWWPQRVSNYRITNRSYIKTCRWGWILFFLSQIWV